jgi:hypothetical protein
MQKKKKRSQACKSARNQNERNIATETKYEEDGSSVITRYQSECQLALGAGG